MINPAPNSIRKTSQRASQIVSTGGATRSLPRKIARNPLSNKMDSQPNEYHVCPTLTIDRYSTQIASQASIAAHNGTRLAAPATMAADSVAPNQATAAKNRSE
ncbi:hypothetical protein C1Y40_04175 [Mycobacterium talmoniae]|uniref:Uncharacterized protein n=1 Tax=Mycobacterium talmoniae TaxID=1858794 RepID=A0A2S8BG66_9MYCO|nr:hypothetical protein C1Y40_04175 [Mycobacterium talmoniae]